MAHPGVINLLRIWLFGPLAEPREEFCQSCETLKEQLAFANYDRKILMENFIRATLPNKVTEESVNLDELEPIRNQKFVPWRVKQGELEKASRERAQQLKPELKSDAPRTVTMESIEKLEEELGVKDVRETVREGS